MDSFLPYLLHAALTVAAILAGIQDWRTREIADWLTWPLFVCGVVGASMAAVRLNFLPIAVSVLLIVTWYFGWLGGADVRVFIGLWGLWPLAGFLALLVAGLWGTFLLLQNRGNEKIPALVSTAFAVGLVFIGGVLR